MNQEIIYKENERLTVKNNEIRICLYCGSSEIDSFEFGISCEDCGVFLRRTN